MQKEDFSFLSSDNSTQIHAIKCYNKNIKITKIIQIIHGMTEYIDKYIPFIEYLTSFGFLVVGHDQLGHGSSFTKSEDQGYFGEPDPNKNLIEDIHKLRKMTQEKNKDLPYFMLGHSMGSYLLRQYITIYNNNLAGVLLLGTGYVPPCATSLGLKLISIFACFKGWKHKSLFIKNLISGSEIKKFDTTGKDLNNSWLTRDPEMAKKLINDKKSGFVFTLNGYYGLLQCINYVCNNSNVVKVKRNLPILFLSGKNDLVGDYGKGVITSAEVMKKIGSVDVTVKLFENDRHELLNEIDRKDVYNYIVNWIEQKCKLFEDKKINNL
jgi:alpha-beta hydrolase superfamily lysophospholipase